MDGPWHHCKISIWIKDKLYNFRPQINQIAIDFIMIRERVIWEVFGKKLISYQKFDDGTIVGSGFLNPLVDRFRVITMFVAQAKFYKHYDSDHLDLEVDLKDTYIIHLCN